MGSRSRRVTDSAVFWLWMFVLLFGAAVVGDVFGITSILSHFMAALTSPM